MFKKTRRRIVASVLLVLLLVLGGTFGVIYLASYADMTHENRGLLEQYVEAYSYPAGVGPDILSAVQSNTPPPDDTPHMGPPRLELSTFYSVAVASDGTVLKVDTAKVSTISRDDLVALAQEIIDNGKVRGEKQHLLYCMADKGGYTLVAFLDNTVVWESVTTLIEYTILFGCTALVLLGILAWGMAARIVAPLEESYQRQKQFVSDAGHELKTPVAVLDANLELLARQVGPNPWIANMQYESERMSSLIRQLLDLARAENAAVQFAALDFSRLVCGEMLPFESVAYEQGLSLQSTVEDGIWIAGDCLRLQQLVSILLDNAVSHSERGAVITLALRREKRYAVLSVSNEGKPIAPEVQAHLFERFYRQDSARTDDRHHYGLGLAIAKAIAENHKGSIWVRCRDGTIEFPVRIPLHHGDFNLPSRLAGYNKPVS